MTDIQTTSLLLQLFCHCFHYYHYYHRYNYPYHHFIINISCYAPSVFTCIVGGAIQMTVYICITFTLRTNRPVQQRTAARNYCRAGIRGLSANNEFV